MATVADSILLKLGVDPGELISGLKSAISQIKSSSGQIKEEANKVASNVASGQRSVRESVKETTNRVNQAISSAGKGSMAFEGMTQKWAGAVKGMLRTVAAPIAGAFAFGSTIKTYFSGVAQVAQMTGAYSTKMEEWRKKRALLARVNREDIVLYKQGREALLKFQLVMADLSTTVMRAMGPAIKWLIGILNRFSDWIDRNQPNIVRFGTIAIGVISAFIVVLKILRGHLLKVAAAMLANPMTWVIAGVAALIILIDDLVTYLRGGDSLFGAFWGPAIKWCKQAWDWLQKFWDSIINSTAFQLMRDIFTNLYSHISNGISQLIDLIGDFFANISVGTGFFSLLGDVAADTWDLICGLFQVASAIILGGIGAIVAFFTQDTTIMSKSWQLLCEGIKNLFGDVKGFVFGIIDSIVNVFTRMVGTVKNKLTGIMPDWAKKMLGISSSGGDTGGEPSIYAGTDAPVVPAAESAVAAGESANRAKAAQSRTSNNSSTTYNEITVNTNSERVADAVVAGAQDAAARDFSASQSDISTK